MNSKKKRKIQTKPSEPTFSRHLFSRPLFMWLCMTIRTSTYADLHLQCDMMFGAMTNAVLSIARVRKLCMLDS